ncbi:MAG TPA: DNA polymerase III subunit beta [Chloroflexi bacterium]|jgi:DNA polymerase-3 subunit beta|nr:DNA polymerase III subunit beta [Chloroflexota bacterium]
MKVSCLQENLAKGLAIVGRAVATRSTLPVLSNILLSTDGSRLKLSATNLEVGINCWIGAKVEQEGATTVPARLLADFVNSLPPERIDLDLITRTQTLNLKCGRFEANIKGIDAQEFPLILVPEEDSRLTIKPEVLRQMIDQVAFAAATDESRPVLTGVLAEVADGKLTLAAADGYRLSVRPVGLEDADERTISVIIPARALQELRRIAGEQDQPVEMLIAPNRNQVFFHMHDVDLVSQLVEGAFPDYRQIIPSNHTTRTIVNAADFLKAVRMAFIFARDAANIVRLQIIPGADGGPARLIVTATSAEHGDNVSELDAEVEGAPIEIAFNARYLIEALAAVDTPDVSLETRDPSSPGVIRPVNGSEFVHVIMPMYMAR